MKFRVVEDFLARDDIGIASLHQLEAGQRKLLDDRWKEEQWSKQKKEVKYLGLKKQQENTIKDYLDFTKIMITAYNERLI